MRIPSFVPAWGLAPSSLLRPMAKPKSTKTRAKKTSSPRSTPKAASQEPSEVTYGSYLALNELLSLQRPRSKPEHPDELLFIIVHQSSELWFKVLLRDFETLYNALTRHDGGLALWQMQRINGVMRIVSAQLSSLALLPPQHFAAFRANLGTSSGSQSAQFRALEAASGLREDWFLKLLQDVGPVPVIVQRWLDRPPLQTAFLQFLDKEGLSLVPP